MSCDRARELMIDALVQPLAEAERLELQRHIEDCDDCAAEAEATRALWEELGDIAIPPPSADGLERLQAAVQSEFGESSPAKSRSTHPWLAAAAAVVLVAVGSLMTVGMQSVFDSPRSTEADDNRARYLMIMTNTQEPPELDARVSEEIQQWFADLRIQGVLEAGSGMLLGESVTTPADGPLVQLKAAGAVVIRVRNQEEARQIVADSPIIKYGGSIEIRAID